MGQHVYEDDGQFTDINYHMLADVERQHVEKGLTMSFRTGSVIRFNVGSKQPVFPHHLI